MGSSFFAEQRSAFHRRLGRRGVLSISTAGIASNADRKQAASRDFSLHIAKALNAPTRKKLSGQTAGARFEEDCAAFLEATFTKLQHLRPGEWTVERVQGRGPGAGVSRFEQYMHLRDLDRAVVKDPTLQTVLGNAYAIAPDVVVFREPVSQSEINKFETLVDESVGYLSSLQAQNNSSPILHAVVSCKWTIRSDRAQNARSEALNLVRNRKGRLPHVAVVTGEPTPKRIASLGLGTGDLDCVYHFALAELVDAIAAHGDLEDESLLNTMIRGRRLRDIADLPLDLVT